MPSMANITVKKNDGTTDVTYTAVIPSAGDSSPAVWRNNTIGAAIGHRPQLSIKSRDNGDKTGRRIDMAYGYPELVTSGDTGVTSVQNRFVGSASVLLPVNMDETDANEAAAQFGHLIASALVVAIMQSGYSAS